MASVNKLLIHGLCAISLIHRKKEARIIPPTVVSVKLLHRHQFDGIDSHSLQIRKLAHCTIGFRADQDPEKRYYSPKLGGGASKDITVYAYEITTPEGGEGLEGLMYACRDKLSGILNGLDYTEYDPQKDVYLTNHYNEVDYKEGKALNKTRLQKNVSLPVDGDVFLIGMVSRMTDQKGFDLIAYIMDELLSTERVQFVVAGTGEARYQDMLSYFAGKYPDKMKVHIGYSEELAHQIYASCDAFLMPSLFEPCGLSQLMSLRYGTVPIVRETGGLKDTVIPYNEYTKEGTGFSFANYNAHEMLATIRYALSVFYQHKNDWDILIKHGMSQDFSWNASVAEYEKLYDSLMTKFTW